MERTWIRESSFNLEKGLRRFGGAEILCEGSRSFEKVGEVKGEA